MLREHHWPADYTPVTHGHVPVHLLAEEPEDEWTTRDFQLQHVCTRERGVVTPRKVGSPPGPLAAPLPRRLEVREGREAQGRLRVIRSWMGRDGFCPALRPAQGPRSPQTPGL